MTSNADPMPAPAPGAVELREDAPLTAAGGGPARAACCAEGPRLALGCFAALSAAVTLALATQIYYGDFQVVPHGGVASDAAACSEAGTLALKEGGRAVDASVVTALCLAVLAPHRTSLDASGSLLYWEYRQARTQAPLLAEWGAPAAGPTSAAGAPPRLLAALAALHAQYGVLSWGRVLKPAIDFARNGFPVSESLSEALAARGAGSGSGSGSGSGPDAGPRLAAYLEALQHNTSAQLSAAWSEAGAPAPGVARADSGAVGGVWRLVAGGRAAAVRRALRAALQPPPATVQDAEARVVAALQAEDALPAAPPAAVGTGLAVVDPFDTYVALVTGLSAPFGSGAATAAGWTRDAPPAPLELTPAMLVDGGRVCGTRYVLGGASGAALAQAAAALAAGADAAAAVERPRARVGADAAAGSVNVVRQQADALLTHADSRGGGLASRF